MPLPWEPELEELLRRCVVRIEIGKGHGSGFFVTPELVLTCYHVVEAAIDKGKAITVVTHDGGSTPGKVLKDEARGPGWPDLALVRVARAAGQPCVVVDAAPTGRGVGLLVAGYPSRTQVSYQTREFDSGGEENYDIAGGRYLRLKADDVVVGGMSGSPVVSLETGFVCGVLRLTLDDGVALGGFAVPMSTVIQQLPAVQAVHDRPDQGAAEWLGILGAVHLKNHDRDADGSRWGADVPVAERVDLELILDQPSPAPLSRWTVKAVTDPSCTALVRVADLGDTVMEAVDRWSRRRPFEEEAEVGLLGRMLYKALLPTPVEGLVQAQAGTGRPLLVRIRVDPANRLADIPWEYARNDQDDPVGTTTSFAFSRFVDVDSDPVHPSDRLRVLGVVVIPPTLQANLPPKLTKSGIERPDGDQLADALKQELEGHQERFEPVVLRNINMTKFTERLTEGPWDVVHFIGLGWEQDGTLGFADGTKLLSVPVSNVINKLSRQRCSLVVLQLLLPPLDLPGPPLGAAKLLPLLDQGVQALVVAQHAATSLHVTSFNEPFYGALAEGESVEVAAQRARQALVDAPPHLDFTAFGAVTVTTTKKGDLRLLTPLRLATRAEKATSYLPAKVPGPSQAQPSSVGAQQAVETGVGTGVPPGGGR